MRAEGGSRETWCRHFGNGPSCGRATTRGLSRYPSIHGYPIIHGYPKRIFHISQAFFRRSPHGSTLADIGGLVAHRVEHGLVGVEDLLVVRTAQSWVKLYSNRFDAALLGTAKRP